MKWRLVIAWCLFASVLLAGSIVHVGCRITSADNVIRAVGINVGGLYSRGGARIVSRHSGAAITTLNVIQDGDSLQAVDNNGLIFRGTIGQVNEGGGAQRSATFTLNGMTTAGAEGVITGSFTVQGNESTMQGTWAEPTLFGSVLATANVTPVATNGAPQTNTNVVMYMQWDEMLAWDGQLPEHLWFMEEAWNSSRAM